MQFLLLALLHYEFTWYSDNVYEQNFVLQST